MSSLSLALSIMLLAPLATGTARQGDTAARLVYVGTYTTGQSRGIYAFRFDEGAGRMTPLGLMAETRSRDVSGRHRWPPGRRHPGGD